MRISDLSSDVCSSDLDYTPAGMTAKAAALPGWQARLAAIDPAGWPVEQADDYLLVKAEMNGMDFDQRVLRPWARDPSFYVTVWPHRSEEHTSELQSLMRISYAVFCLKKKKQAQPVHQGTPQLHET